MKKILISFSGGLDSTTLLAYCLNEGMEVHAVSFSYGSKHNKYENEAAKRIIEHYKIPFHFFDLTSIFNSFQSSLLQSGGPIPEGHYQAESMRQTVVPARNMIFISILTGLAESLKIPIIGLGVHAGDHFIYPDCRPGFIRPIRKAIFEATDNSVQLFTPFLMLTKKEIIDLSWSIVDEIPYHLTRTCYKDQEKACGVCGSCQERLEAFKLVGIPDPIQYEVKEV